MRLYTQLSVMQIQYIDLCVRLKYGVSHILGGHWRIGVGLGVKTLLKLNPKYITDGVYRLH